MTAVVVPDNLKTGVTKACFYEPDLNPAYREWAEHYGTVILPARPRQARATRPRSKTPCSRSSDGCWPRFETNVSSPSCRAQPAIRERLVWLNDRPFSRSLGYAPPHFLEVDRPALRPLPGTASRSPSGRSSAGVGIDYHVEFDHHFYSVPYQLVQREWTCAPPPRWSSVSTGAVAVASHRASHVRGGFTTESSHRPKSHQRHVANGRRRASSDWAETIGPEPAPWSTHILSTKPHPEQGYRSCLGIIRLAKKYTKERVEAAARRAIRLNRPPTKPEVDPGKPPRRPGSRGPARIPAAL